MRNIVAKLLVIFAALVFSACQTNSKSGQPADSPASNNLPYAVGSSTRFIHDASRPYDSVAGVDVGVRTLVTEIWYPVEQAQVAGDAFRQATYGDYVFRDKDVHRLMMTQTTFFHLTPDTVIEGVSQVDIDLAIDELFERQRGSYVDAPLAGNAQPWPVVVMTHGDAGSRYNMETACEYLAAHGYVVIAPEHTGNSPFSQTGRDPALDAAIRPYLNADGTYGSKDKFGQTYTPLSEGRANPQALVSLDNSLLERVNDLRATLRELDDMNQQGEFAGRLDLSKIGLMGRSFGGTTTLAALALEPRFTAGVAVVPLVMPDVRQGLPPALLKPVGQESVILNAQGPTTLSTISKPTMLLSGAEDGLIIGIGGVMAQSTGSTKPTPGNPLPPLRAAYESSDQPVFWGLLRDSNHASFGVSGSYWWPQYKTDRQKRFFEPELWFKLVKPATAHLIQREKVKQFMDVMIRGDQASRAALSTNQFSEQGLLFESRNFPAEQ